MRFLLFSTLLFFAAACTTSRSAKTSSKPNPIMQSQTADWKAHTNIYEVNTRQYTPEGTFNALLPHLPRLKEMGVHTLWFMPITPIAQKNKKGSMGSPYACSDYTAINPEFGTMEDFKRLVREAHAQGFKVIIDWVANHTGWDHRWTREHPEYFEKDSATNDFKIASGMDDIIELDFKNPALRKAMIDAMRFWITEAGIDGFRCDLAFWVELDFWQEARAAIDPDKKLYFLGELDPLDHPDYMQVFDAAYTWTWMHKTRDWYKNRQPMGVLDSVMQRYDTTAGVKAWFTTNHDENSWNGTEYEKYGDAAKALAVFSYTWKGVPLVYNGQELPNNKRLQFFEKDAIEWDTAKLQLKDFYRTLNRLKREHPALHPSANAQRMGTSADDKVMAFLRKEGGREVLVLLNFSGENLDLTLTDNRIDGNFKEIFTGEGKSFTNVRALKMAAWSYQVYEK